MARMVIFGGTGHVGRRIADEALRRGHEVTSYTRHHATEPLHGVTYLRGNIADPTVREAAAEGADVVVVAVRGTEADADADAIPLAELVPGLADAAVRHHARLAVFGGASGSPWKPETESYARVLDALRESPRELDWFYVSPGARFGQYAPGELLSAFRADLVVTKKDGFSEVPTMDLALAFLDEIDTPKRSRRRFSTDH